MLQCKASTASLNPCFGAARMENSGRPKITAWRVLSTSARQSEYDGRRQRPLQGGGWGVYERILEDRRRGMTAERGVAALSEESRSGGSRPAGSGSDRTRTRRFQRRYARECQTLRDGRWRWRPTDGRSETGPRVRRLEKWNTRCGQAEQTLRRAIFILRWLTRQRGVGPLPWPSPSAMRLAPVSVARLTMNCGSY